MELNELSGEIVDSAVRVHSLLGPGLLEHVYQACLKYELSKRGVSVFSEVAMPVSYDGVDIDLGYRLDLLVDDRIIIEVKSVITLAPVHHAQLLTYLKLSRKPLGLILNFGRSRLADGIVRLAN